MAMCGFNEKMLEGIRALLDGAIEYGIIDRAKKNNVSIEEQFKREAKEISSFIKYSRNVTDKPTQKQIEGVALLVGGTFEKDQKRGIKNYIKQHKSDIKLLDDIDNQFYGPLKGDIKNMPKLFDWVNEKIKQSKHKNVKN